MLKMEIEYRLCRLLLTNLQEDRLLSSEEVREVNRLLIETIDPPFRTLENIEEKIGDGVKIRERQKNH